MIDLHQDLLLHVERPGLFESPGQTSFEQIERGGIDVVFATAWPEPYDRDYLGSQVPGLVDEAITEYALQAERRGWGIITDHASLDRALVGRERPAILLHIEGLNVLGKHPFERLDSWWGRGVRSIGLTWNLRNSMSGGVEDPEEGLTALGRDVVRWASTRGVIIDLAHISPAGFWDVLDVIEQPPVVTHAGARALHDHARNLDDAQLRAIAARDGIAGVFLVPRFLTTSGEATLRDVVRHATHIASVAGVRHLAIGTDLGGIATSTVKGCSSVDQLENLTSALADAGFSAEEIEMVSVGNAARVVRATLG